MQPLITNDRDRRTWAWIVQQVGEDRALAVELAGDRKPYPSNIAKALGLELPESLKCTPRTAGLQRLAEMKKLISE